MVKGCVQEARLKWFAAIGNGWLRRYDVHLFGCEHEAVVRGDLDLPIGALGPMDRPDRF